MRFSCDNCCCYLHLQAEDLLDDILSFESSSLADSLKLDGTYGGGGANGVTTGSNSDLVIKQEPSAISDAEMHALAKDRQKKDNHNMSMSINSFDQDDLYYFNLMYYLYYNHNS